MSDRDKTAEAKKPSVGGELIIPVAGILFTAYYFSTIIDAPWTAQVNAVFLGSILILLSLILIGMRIRAVWRGTARFSFHELIEPVDILGKRLSLLAIAIGYVLIVDYAGFTTTTFLLLFCGMTALGLNNWRRTLLIALGLALAIWLVFVVGFETRLPYGPFETFMNRLI